MVTDPKTDARARLLELSRESRSSLSELSKLIGKNATYLQQFVRKGSPRKLGEEERRKLAGFFGVDEGELGAPEDFSHPSQARRGDFLPIPRLALGASAGPGALAVGEAPVGAFQFSSRWLRGNGLEPAQLSAIRVEGDSMEPTLRDGDEILVDRTPRAWRDGIHVVRSGEALLVKRLDLARPGTITLVSDNKAYAPVELPIEEVEVIGRVVWKSGRL